MASCYSFQNPTFQKAMRIISSITRANPAVITTTFDHNYITGMIVRLVIPEEYGMQQINKLTGIIIVTGDTTFSIDIDSTNFDAFSIPGTTYECPQVIPIGEISEILEAATQNVLPY